jgi:carboxyl-terminal processing protease
VRIVTEGLGSKRFHGRIALLVDESTTGAGERIAAFAKERQLAPVVGSKTAGRLICCSVYKVSHGYYVRIPARAWYTWRGDQLEGKGVLPDRVATNDGRESGDAQLDQAVAVVRTL